MQDLMVLTTTRLFQDNFFEKLKIVGGQATNNTEIINVLTFIQQTMETLSAYSEQLKAKLDINLTHQ